MRWESFDVFDFIQKKPKVILRRFFEINPLGELRYITDIKNPRYKTVKPVKVNGKSYFMTNIGWSHGNTVIARIPIEYLVKRFFSD